MRVIMKVSRKILAGVLMGSVVISMWSPNTFFFNQKRDNFLSGTKVQAAETKTLTIDGKTKRTETGSAFRGLGAVTCNGSSRLLMDYKQQHPTEYWEIMNWLFSPTKGAGLSHIKIELGCDSDTSSGAEPATKRSSREKANVRRGAGFMFAHDALTINPNISVDMLCWGMPGWVENAYAKSDKAGYKARYKWYKETIDAAYDVWGIRMSYVSANQNEREIEKGWTKYLANALDHEKYQRYDYSKIKIVAADETDNMYVADDMLKDKKFRDAVDVLGFHYNSYMNSKVKKLHTKYKKEIWFSEGASVATDSIFGANNTVDGQTTSGTNGMLDIANRIIIAMAQSDMTMYEFQPAVAAYFDGSVYYPKQLVSANHPWSGYYENGNGLVMAMHFTNFIKKGWKIVESGSYGDGVQSDHYITKTKNDYLTAMCASTEDYSTVITNDSKTTRTYQVKVSNLKKAASKVSVWETKTADKGESYDDNWLKKIDTITPKKSGNVYIYTVKVAPYSMVTLTTTTGQKSYQQKKQKTSVGDTTKNTSLELPYTEDFEYSSTYLKRRGGAPNYTHDVEGAFEVVKDGNGNRVLQQKINPDKRTLGWGSGKSPVTSLGDDTWKDYIVSADVVLDANELGNNYAGISARYNNDSVDNAYWLRIYRDGTWRLKHDSETVKKGKISGMAQGRLVNLKLKVVGNTVTGYINGEKVVEKTFTTCLSNSGRVGLCSNFYKNTFDNIQVLPVSGGESYVTRVDNMNSGISYTGSVELLQSQSYENYGRTVSSMKKKGAALSYTFEGTGIAFLGAHEGGAKIKVTVDGEVLTESTTIKECHSRNAFYQVKGLAAGRHTVKLELLNNYQLDIDALETASEKYSTEVVQCESLEVENARIELAYGKTVSAGVTAVPKAALSDITYMTSNMAVANVTSDGMIYGNGAGTAVITAKSADGKSVSIEVEVTRLLVSPGAGVRVGAGEKVKLSASFQKKINNSTIKKWVSSDKKIATVSKSGVVKTKKSGTVTITAVGKNGYQGSVLIRVKRAPYQVKLSPKKLNLKKGKTKQLKYSVPKGCKAMAVTYQSSNKKVATVTKSGVVKGKKAGSCTITVKTYNGKKAKMQVRVR